MNQLFEDFHCNREDGNWPVVVDTVYFTFFENRSYPFLFPNFRDNTRAQREIEDVSKIEGENRRTKLQRLNTDSIPGTDGQL